jgi:hypothetical protein
MSAVDAHHLDNATATILGSFTDWLFMDVLVRCFYTASPALWPPRGGTARILVPQVTGTAATLRVSLQELQWMRLPPAVAAS